MAGMERQADETRVGKVILQYILRHVLALTGGAVLGLAALLAVFSLPTGQMQLHVWQSMPMLEKEFESDQLLEGYPASMVGNFTDCLMLEHAIYHNEQHSLLEQALYMYRGESGGGEGWAPGYSLTDFLSGIPQPREVEYSRYWHGYLVILKPMLHFMTFNSIRVFAAAVQLFLAGFIAMLCAGRGEKVLGTGFLVSLPFLYFFSLHYSLSLSICFYIMAAVLSIQLKYHERIAGRGWYPALFLLCGMATAYFDFLTYPLVTLGFPLCVSLYLYQGTAKENLKRLAGYSAEWGIGYLGLWAMKWLLTDLLAGGSTIRDAMETILMRTNSAEGYSKLSGFAEVVKQNLGAFRNWGFYLLFAAIVIWALIWLFLKQKRQGAFFGRKETCLWRQSAVFLLVALFPFAWWFAAQNHSQQHWIFTCKIFSVSIFAMVCALGKLLGNRENREENAGHGKI